MKATLSVVAILAAAVQQTNATFSWGTNKFFPNPFNCDNKCSDYQKSGFDWVGLGLGAFSSFGDFDFSGFICGDRKPPKSSFQNKCIQGKLLRGITNGSPKISHGKSNGFSITSFQITVDEDTDIAFVYTMPDGSTCKHTTPCSKGGSEVQNTQCGGAVSVKFSLPQYSKLDNCGFAIHKIVFDCGPPITPSKPVVTPTNEISTDPTRPTPDPESGSQSYSVSLPPTTELPESYTVTPPSETFPPGTSPEATPTENTPPDSTPPGATPPQNTPSGSTPPEATVPGTAPPVVTPPEVTPPGTTPTPTEIVSYSTSTVFTTAIITVTGCAPEVPSCPADSTEVVTSTIAISTTICPITVTPTSPDPIVTGPTPTNPAPTGPTDPTDTTTPPIPSVPAPDTSTYPVDESTTSLPGSSGSPVTQTSPPGATVTEITYTTVTTCPVTQTITSGTAEITVTTTTLSTITITTTGTVCLGCSVPTAPGSTGTSDITSSPPPPPITDPAPPGSAIPLPSSAPPGTDSPSPSPPNLPPAVPIEAPCPKVVPQCLNTWLNLVPKCGSNSDISCFCPSSEFTSAVIACIQSWGASNDEIQSALSYFTGICAAHVPKNPGIITAIPSTITLTPPPAPTQPAGQTGRPTIVTPPPQAPCTTITVSQVITVSGTETSTLTTIVTVPQVQFITETIAGATTGVNVGLVPGTTALPAKTPMDDSYLTATQASTFATIPLSPTVSQTSNPFTDTGDAFSLSVPSTLWILSAVTIVMGLLQ